MYRLLPKATHVSYNKTNKTEPTNPYLLNCDLKIPMNPMIPDHVSLDGYAVQERE